MLDENEEKSYMGIGIGIGIAIGTTLGVMFDNIGIGIGLGMMFGTSIGVILDGNKEDVKKDLIRFVLVGGIIISVATFVAPLPKIIDYLL